jgi:ribosomal protein S18 acetylase RimI-like enzyme
MNQLASVPLGTTGFTIRRATAADVPAIGALLADDDIGAARELPAGADLTPYTLAFEALDADPAHLLLVVSATATATDVAATMQLSFIPGMARQGALRAQIEAVRVSSQHRGQGLGEAIMTWAIAEARRRNCHLVQLTSDKRRTRAHRFYERLGFTAVSEGFKLPL